MKDPNAMTVDECRDELAILRCPGGHRYDEFSKTHYWKAKISADWSRNHPITATLDEAAKLPEGWDARIYVNRHGVTVAKAFHYDATLERIGNTEKEARFRLRVAAERLARQGEGGGQ